MLEHNQQQKGGAQVLRQQKRAKLLTFLGQRFPNSFLMVTPQPLKKQCLKDIADDWQLHVEDYPACSRVLLREVIHFYASRKRYHKACIVDSAMRVNLLGQAVELVTATEKMHHQERLADYRHKQTAAKPSKDD